MGRLSGTDPMKAYPMDLSISLNSSIHLSIKYQQNQHIQGFLVLLKVILVLFNARLQCQPIVNRILYFQLFYMKHVFEKSLGMKSWSDKISAFLKGPGWFPGTERLGDLSMVPEVQVKSIP